jgi:dihydrofolate reductase
MISAIVAIDKNYAIGKGNQLPWHMPADLAYFKKTTMGHPVIMGRKTYESMGKPLPGRTNIVVSSNNPELPEGVVLVHNVEDARAAAEKLETDEVFIIGGQKLFESSFDTIDKLYVTVIDTIVEDADAFFPHIDHAQWKLTWEEAHEPNEKNKFAYTFQHWVRLKEI